MARWHFSIWPKDFVRDSLVKEMWSQSLIEELSDHHVTTIEIFDSRKTRKFTQKMLYFLMKKCNILNPSFFDANIFNEYEYWCHEQPSEKWAYLKFMIYFSPSCKPPHDLTTQACVCTQIGRKICAFFAQMTNSDVHWNSDMSKLSF